MLNFHPAFKALRQINVGLSPFCSPLTTSMPRRGGSSSSPLLSLPLLIVLLPIVAFTFIFFAVRPFLSLTSHSLRSTSVKKSWDFLNISLVLFAILCGIFARKNDSEESANASSASNKARTEEEEEQSTTHQWFKYSETKICSSTPAWAPASPATGVTGLKRSSSSYPDLRQEYLRETGDDRFQFRFFDDFEIDRYRSVGPRNEPEEPEIKVIPVDTFVPRSSPSQPPPAKSPPPPPPPPTHPPGVHHESKRTYRTVRRKEDDDKSTKTRPPPPPPPLPTPSPARSFPEQKYGKSERKKSNFKKEIAMAWTSLYHQKKRKKKQSKTKNIYDEPVQSSAEPAANSRPPPSPPPPPPPPSPSVFHILFRKNSKSKKVHSVSTTPPPPPPPPPVRLPRSSERKISAPTVAPEPSSRRSSSFSPASRPPLPTRGNSLDKKVILAWEQSPVIPIPPPPPSPPFKTREMRFFECNGFVRMQSAQSSGSASPEPGDDDPDTESSAGTVNPIDGTDGGGAASVFCPSPDVNIKAATFIARLRDNWKLEKINSLREKEKMGLGPGP